MGQWSGTIWVSATTALILFLGLSSQLYIILPTCQHSTRQEFFSTLIPFNLLLLLLLSNYFLCIVTEPGKVPLNWRPYSSTNGPSSNLVASPLRSPRFCRICKAYKPPRSHHCKTCKRCVLKMDHHCPWINNCAGHHNHPHFIRFLIYVVVTLIYHQIMISKTIFWIDPSSGGDHWMMMKQPTQTFMVVLVMNYVLGLPTLLLVGMFTIYHVWCLAANTTTIEAWEKDRAQALYRRGRIAEFQYPFSLGILHNIKSVLGPNPLLWLVPGIAAPGDGLKYPVGKGMDFIIQYDWPPRDEFHESNPPRNKVRDRTSKAAFTYGEETLNPQLLHRRPNRQGSREAKRVRNRSSKAPFEQGFSPPTSSDEEDQVLEEDDIPLAQLSLTRNENGPLGNVRVRRGSEGYEVRPNRPFHIDSTSASFDESRQRQSDERGFQDQSAATRFGIELDHEQTGFPGDYEKRIKGKIYQVYEPDDDDESDLISGPEYD